MSGRQRGGRYTPPKERRYGLGRAGDGWRLLDGDPVRARARLDRLGPVGDQLEAALGDQLGLLRGMFQTDIGFTDTWAAWATSALRAWAAGGAHLCDHVAGGGPQPVWILAWDPVLRCTPCMLASQVAVRGTPEDTTCDACRASGLPSVWSAAVTCGNLTVFAGLCGSCRPATTAQGAA